MKVYSLLSLSLWLLVNVVVSASKIGHGGDDDDDKWHYQPRIINGTTAREGAWPFMAFMRSKYRCGGAVLNEDTIVTAAHCLFGQDVDGVSFVLGVVNLDYVGDRDIYKAKSYTVHEKYNDEDQVKEYDIGIVKLSRKIDFKKGSISPVCVPDGPNIYDGLDDDHCITLGWGLMSVRQTESKTLQQLRYPLQNDTACKKGTYYPYDPAQGLLTCAGYENSGKQVCYGDSGGPLICPYKDEQDIFTLIGINCYAPRCEVGKTFGYFTKVTTFLDWIKRKALQDA